MILCLWLLNEIDKFPGFSAGSLVVRRAWWYFDIGGGQLREVAKTWLRRYFKAALR